MGHHVSSVNGATGNLEWADLVENSGTGTLNGTTAVNVAWTGITASHKIYLGILTPAGTVTTAPYVFSKTAGTGFSVKTTASDTSVFSWYATL